MSDEDFVSIQRELVARERAKEMVKQGRLKRDVRSQMSRSGWYNPEGDGLPDGWEPQLYPTWVHLKQADGSTRSVIANNKQEHDELLGRKPEAAKPATVDVAALAMPQEVKQKRKYTKRSAPAPLPQNLE